MPADYVIKEGDRQPVLTDTLEYANREKANLEGATVQFVLRNLTSEAPLTVTGTTSVTTAKEGKVQFAPSAADTAKAGEYMASWQVTFSNGQRMTFPTTGYLWVQIEPSLSTRGGAQIVSLPQVKQHLAMYGIDRVNDDHLLLHIEGIRPLIENATGPLLVQVFEEWHEGGHATVALRHPPSVGFGTTPILNLMAVSEYRGPIEYNLALVPNPTLGSVYSAMADDRMGVVVRRTSGGGTSPFWRDDYHGKQTVHVIYAAGQERIPANVTLAALEAIRVNYRTTMATGRGRDSVADAQEFTVPMGFFLPRRCLELLEPTKRAPSIA